MEGVRKEIVNRVRTRKQTHAPVAVYPSKLFDEIEDPETVVAAILTHERQRVGRWKFKVHWASIEDGEFVKVEPNEGPAVECVFEELQELMADGTIFVYLAPELEHLFETRRREAVAAETAASAALERVTPTRLETLDQGFSLDDEPVVGPANGEAVVSTAVIHAVEAPGEERASNTGAPTRKLESSQPSLPKRSTDAKETTAPIEATLVVDQPLRRRASCPRVTITANQTPLTKIPMAPNRKRKKAQRFTPKSARRKTSKRRVPAECTCDAPVPQPSVTASVSENAPPLRRSTRTRTTRGDSSAHAPKQALDGITEGHKAGKWKQPAWKKNGTRNNRKKRKVPVKAPVKAPTPAPSASLSRGVRPQWWPDSQSKDSAAQLLHDRLEALASGSIETVPIVRTPLPFREQRFEQFIYGIVRKDGDGVCVDYDKPFEGMRQQQFALDADSKNSIRYLVDLSLMYLYDASSPTPPAVPSGGVAGVTPAERAKLRRRAARHPNSSPDPVAEPSGACMK